MRNEFYKDTQGVLLVYDVGSKESFDSLDSWLAEMKQELGPHGNMDNVVFVVCANKVGATEFREFPRGLFPAGVRVGGGVVGVTPRELALGLLGWSWAGLGVGSGIVGIIPWELAMGLLRLSNGNWIWDCWDGPIGVGSGIVGMVLGRAGNWIQRRWD